MKNALSTTSDFTPYFTPRRSSLVSCKMSLKERWRVLGLKISMQDEKPISLDQLRAFLEASDEMRFKASDRQGSCTGGWDERWWSRGSLQGSLRRALPSVQTASAVPRICQQLEALPLSATCTGSRS